MSRFFCGNSEIKDVYKRQLVDNVVSDQLAVYLEEHPVVARTILDKALTANRAREAARKARESIRRKTALGLRQLHGDHGGDRCV